MKIDFIFSYPGKKELAWVLKEASDFIFNL